MATVDGAGITPRDLSGYVDLLRERFLAEYGSDLSLAPETIQGQIIAIMSLSGTEQDEALVAVANGLDITRAIGNQLVALGSILGITKTAGARSTVMATLSGTSGTTIPIGSRARTAAGDEFALDAAATIPVGGSIDAEMSAVVDGPVPAAAGALSQIVTLVSGWTGVTNAAAATLGRFTETDSEFRTRYGLLTARLASSGADALRAALVGAGAERIRVEVNATSADVTLQTLTTPAHGILVIAEGGEDADIAAAILRVKHLGAAMGGSTTDGGAMFERVAEVPVKVAFTILLGADIPSDGLTRIRTGLVAHSETFVIGEAIDTSRLLTPILAVPGHSITVQPVLTSGGSALPALPALNERYAIASGDIAITLA